MAADMSGFQGPDGAKRWMAASGGTMADYNREMAAWQSPTSPLNGVGGSDAAVAQANAAYNAGQRGSDPSQIFQPGQLEAMRAGAANSSEDYKRYDNNTMAGWEQYRIPGTMKYRSMRGAPGQFDKPTECPPGQGPSGGSETDPCTTAGYSTPGPGGAGGAQGAEAGAGAAAGAQGAGPAYFGQDDPLQRMLVNQMASGGGSFAGTKEGMQLSGGGVFSTGAPQYGQNPGTAALSALSPTPAPPPAAAPTLAPTAAPASSAAFSDPYEAWKQGGRKGPQPGTQTDLTTLVQKPVVSIAPPAPRAAAPDAFGISAGTGSLSDLVNPRRQRRDARTGGSWF